MNNRINIMQCSEFIIFPQFSIHSFILLALLIHNIESEKNNKQKTLDTFLVSAIKRQLCKIIMCAQCSRLKMKYKNRAKKRSKRGGETERERARDGKIGSIIRIDFEPDHRSFSILWTQIDAFKMDLNSERKITRYFYSPLELTKWKWEDGKQMEQNEWELNGNSWSISCKRFWFDIRYLGYWYRCIQFSEQRENISYRGMHKIYEFPLAAETRNEN